jgi:hypothetical protein
MVGPLMAEDRTTGAGPGTGLRRQLTLFVPAAEAAALDAARALLDPVQHGLIAAHVTLCREDELAGHAPEALLARVACFPGPASLRMQFDPAQRLGGHGWWRPAVEGAEGFERLRRWILGPPTDNDTDNGTGARKPIPHLTLAHPRNPRAPGNPERLPGPDAALHAAMAGPLALDFTVVSLIEQHGHGPWRTLATAALGTQVLLRGGCTCAAVRYALSERPSAATACHCTMCRRQSGHFFASANVPKAAVHLEDAAPLGWYVSSAKVRRGFCTQCGAALFWEPLFRDWTSVALGSIDGPTGLALERHIFVADKGDYYDIGDGLPQNPH